MRTSIFKLVVLIIFSICTLFEYTSAQEKPLTNENKKSGQIANEQAFYGNDDSIKNFWPESLVTPYLNEVACEFSDKLGPVFHETDSFQIYTSDKPGVKYDDKAQILIFRSKADCEGSDISKRLYRHPYTHSDLSDASLIIKTCPWAKVVKGGNNISNCVKAKLKNGKLEFPLVSNQIPGERFVIVVARSVSFERDGTGVGIQSALSDWFKQLKSQGIRIPLNLLTIEGDGEIRQVLRGEDLNSLALSSNEENPLPNIEGIIGERITFYAEGFRPLKDLEFVERELFSLGINRIEKVFYVTDGELPEKIFNAELGTALGWANDGVELVVVTKGDCAPWIERSRVLNENCISINTRQDIDAFKRYLEQIEIGAKNASTIQTSK